jgi:hypothetical protein
MRISILLPELVLLTALTDGVLPIIIDFNDRGFKVGQ